MSPSQSSKFESQIQIFSTINQIWKISTGSRVTQLGILVSYHMTHWLGSTLCMPIIRSQKWREGGTLYVYFLGLDVGNENHIGVLVIILCHNSP